MEWMIEHWDEILQLVGGIYLVATLIAAFTPTDADDKWLSKVGRLFDRIGLQIKSPKPTTKEKQ